MSYEYRVLFCISAGNINRSINLGRDEAELKTLQEDQIIKNTAMQIHSDIRNRKLLSPAESINALTVGSLHCDLSKPDSSGYLIDILPTQLLPSPVSAHGHGFRNAIKPEIYLPGGRQLFSFIYVNDSYTIANVRQAPGQKVASTSVTPAETNRCVYTRGTSNATALATRGAAQIFEVLNDLKEKNNYDIPGDKMAILLKTLLVHSASWGKSRELLEKCLKKNSDNAGQFKKTISRFLGFGIPNIQRVLECTAQRATAFGFGEIKKDERHEFRLPLPPGLSGSKVMRRLIITLAWFSPVNPDSRKYRKANLSFDPPHDDIGVKRKEADWQQVKNGTIQHEILEGEKIKDYKDGTDMAISIVCRDDAGTLDENVIYGLAVTLEVAEGIDIPVYEEIKEKLGVKVSVKLV